MITQFFKSLKNRKYNNVIEQNKTYYELIFRFYSHIN